MRLSCGLTRQEAEEEFTNYVTKWHKVFAIWPRRVGKKDCRWLEYIERKGSLEKSYGFYSIDYKWVYEYRAIK